MSLKRPRHGSFSGTAGVGNGAVHPEGICSMTTVYDHVLAGIPPAQRAQLAHDLRTDSWWRHFFGLTDADLPHQLAASEAAQFVVDDQTKPDPAGEQVIRLRDTSQPRELRAHERAAVDALLALVAGDRGATKPVPHDPFMDVLNRYMPQHAADTTPALVDRQIQPHDEDAVAAAMARARDRERYGVVTAEDYAEIGRALRRSMPGLGPGRRSMADAPDED